MVQSGETTVLCAEVWIVKLQYWDSGSEDGVVLGLWYESIRYLVLKSWDNVVKKWSLLLKSDSYKNEEYVLNLSSESRNLPHWHVKN
jgi:hypothetical protein